MNGDFSWASALGASVVLFMLAGTLQLGVGALTPVMVRALERRRPVRYLFVSGRADRALYGRPAGELLAGSPALATFRGVLLDVVGGLLLASGLLQIAIAWFGLRAGEWWALGALGLAGALVLPCWGLALVPYRRAGVRLRLGDIPPFMWVPAALLLPGVALGALGLHGG